MAKASEIGRKMLEAYPALRRLENHSEAWARSSVPRRPKQ